MLRLLLALVLVALLAACGGGTDWNQPWLDTSGERVPSVVVTSYRDCDENPAVFLTVGWPLGTKRELNSPGSRTYLRDPGGLYGGEVVVPFAADVTLPAEASYTGYHLDEFKLWVSKRDARKAVYIVGEERVERWPLTTHVVACQ
jgi:hypothetical protein